MFRFSGADSDSLGVISSSSFSKLTFSQMLQVVPLDDPTMKEFLNLVAGNQKLLETAIRQKALKEISHLRTQLQEEQHRSRELDKKLNEANTEQGKVKSLEEEVVQLNTNLSDVATELTRQLDKAQKKHDMELTDGITEGVMIYMNDRRMRKNENASSGSANPKT